MSGFNKLFSSLVTSTVWSEPDTTRIVWITMLAIADRDGVVNSSIPGLAKLAGVSLEATERALETFLGPDKYSRTADNEGRRITTFRDSADRSGWQLINHATYRDILSKEAVRASKAAHMRRVRAAVPHVESSVHNGQLTEAEAETTAKKTKATVQPAAAPPAFEQFWSAYPNKKGRGPALKVWKARKLEQHLATMLANIADMLANDDSWQRGFIPMGSTYLNQERWTDVAAAAPNDVKPAAKAPAPETFGPKAAMATTETKLERELAHIKHQHSLGAYGDGELGASNYANACRTAQVKYGSKA